jgi:hypothetical protein
MERQNESGALPIVELLGVEGAVLTDPERTTAAPVVFLTLRPEPDRSFRSFSFPLSVQQAARLRDDLARVLKQFQPAAQHQ